jgi:subtilisin family serine protease
MMVPQGVRVLNMSFGGTSLNQTRDDALKMAHEAGVVAIAAAGNEGRNNDQIPHYPSNLSLTLDNVVAVAATDQSNRLADFSHYGKQTVDVGAPGVEIWGVTSRDMDVPLGQSDGLLRHKGTSPAAAIVSGIAALIYSEFPGITPLEVKQRLRGGVDRVGHLLDKVVSGGRVNARRALERDDVAPGPITDLRVVSGVSPLTLAWTATGDDGLRGQAAFYEIRYSTTPMTLSNLRSSQKVAGAPFPQPAGAMETFRIATGLSPGMYYFLIRVLDNVGREALSNQLQVIISN